MSNSKTSVNKNRIELETPVYSLGNSLLTWIRERIVTLALLGMMLTGVGLLVYPSFADYWNSFHQTRAVMSYAENVSGMNADEYEKILDSARSYNEELAERGISWSMSDEQKEKYWKELNVGHDGVMGYIRIQKIDVMLPIYHGTDDEILRTSIGHLEESSLPVGGSASHCMLSGHRGLPSARLFTDLDKLKEGDVFTMTILNETLTYEVDHIWIVEPSDMSHLTIEEGKDYCTLITCTPYGVNSHRLLVRGHRVYIAPFLSIPILVIMLLYVLFETSLKRRKQRDLKEEYLEEKGVQEEIEIEDQDIIIEAVKRFRGTWRRN